ncbi:hypothetical protein D8674_025608 [Pyrus ussuriensis x Pyrus communis]|uniref:Uncharacterized protein n=1 Tax=Pyrus ussuriensis x Pyrus communis TaxID=2448454 RepID=A0A5N5IIL5_9ROSA|nr:hypothetical protein D8674_025608 [Pyrus ussuriensis x Pyrus communis]
MEWCPQAAMEAYLHTLQLRCHAYTFRVTCDTADGFAGSGCKANDDDDHMGKTGKTQIVENGPPVTWLNMFITLILVE